MKAIGLRHANADKRAVHRLQDRVFKLGSFGTQNSQSDQWHGGSCKAERAINPYLRKVSTQYP
jgi:hypothetical protein